MDFQKNFKKISERKIYLSQYIEAKSPQAVGFSTNKSVGINSSILSDLSSSLSMENIGFLIPTLAVYRPHNSNCQAKFATNDTSTNHVIQWQKILDNPRQEYPICHD